MFIYVYAYIKLSLIDNLVVTQKEVLSDRWSIQRLIKENQRHRGFCIEQKENEDGGGGGGGRRGEGGGEREKKT